MLDHSRIVDDFFLEPNAIRKYIIESPMRDHMASDGVVYPGIVEIPREIGDTIQGKLEIIFNRNVDLNLMFARHSYQDMNPPNWAHSDYNMAKYVCIVYLSPTDYPWDGTHFLRHKKTKLEIHPSDDHEKDLLLMESNNQDMWDKVYTCPSRFNRAFIFDARYIHAAAYKFGTNRINSRLVLSTFFELK